MEIANVLVALGGDTGNTVPKYEVTAAEVAVLRSIHGDQAVLDIEPTGTVERSNREERSRLKSLYGNARDGSQNSIVEMLYPGAAARVFETFEELELPEIFYKAEARVSKKPVKAAVVMPAGLSKKEQTAWKKAQEEAAKVAAVDEQDEEDGIEDMPSAGVMG
jgi:hypothetical protein